MFLEILSTCNMQIEQFCIGSVIPSSTLCPWIETTISDVLPHQRTIAAVETLLRTDQPPPLPMRQTEIPVTLLHREIYPPLAATIETISHMLPLEDKYPT